MIGPEDRPELRVYTVSDVARMLGCSRQTVRVGIDRGQLPGAFCLGDRLWRFRATVVDAWLVGETPAAVQPASRAAKVG